MNLMNSYSLCSMREKTISLTNDFLYLGIGGPDFGSAIPKDIVKMKNVTTRIKGIILNRKNFVGLNLFIIIKNPR